MPKPLDPAAPLRDTLDDMKGQLRLSEVREAYDGPDFDTAVIALVEAGEIELRPLGNVVKVYRVD